MMRKFHRTRPKAVWQRVYRLFYSVLSLPSQSREFLAPCWKIVFLHLFLYLVLQIAATHAAHDGENPKPSDLAKYTDKGSSGITNYSFWSWQEDGRIRWQERYKRAKSNTAISWSFLKAWIKRKQQRKAQGKKAKLKSRDKRTAVRLDR